MHVSLLSWWCHVYCLVSGRCCSSDRMSCTRVHLTTFMSDRRSLTCSRMHCRFFVSSLSLSFSVLNIRDCIWVRDNHMHVRYMRGCPASGIFTVWMSTKGAHETHSHVSRKTKTAWKFDYAIRRSSLEQNDCGRHGLWSQDHAELQVWRAGMVVSQQGRLTY